MLKEKRLASEVNDQLRDICRILDESAALVRRKSPQEAPRYAQAIAEIFETITEEIFVPLYRQHPNIAPAIWRDLPESKKE